jgi:hypothetical protein
MGEEISVMARDFSLRAVASQRRRRSKGRNSRELRRDLAKGFRTADRYWLALYYCERCFQSGKWKVVTDGKDSSGVWIVRAKRLQIP